MNLTCLHDLWTMNIRKGWHQNTRPGKTPDIKWWFAGAIWWAWLRGKVSAFHQSLKVAPSSQADCWNTFARQLETRAAMPERSLSKPVAELLVLLEVNQCGYLHELTCWRTKSLLLSVMAETIVHMPLPSGSAEPWRIKEMEWSKITNLKIFSRKGNK